ncbi:MAG: EAL domain-containing protein [Thiogranum sp.]
MFSDRSKYVIVGGFSAVMVLMLAVILIGYMQMTQTMRDSERLVNRQAQKTHHVMMMYSSVRERSVGLLRMAMADDPFERDREYLRLNELATQYVINRDALSRLLESPQEREFFQKLRVLAEASAPLQGQVIELLQEDRNEEASALLRDKAIPRQEEMLSFLNNMLGNQELEVKNSVALSRENDRDTALVMGLLTIASALMGFAIIRFVVRKTAMAEQALIAKVTFESIGDAVITTNVAGRIGYLNRQAQRLIGRDEEDVAGCLLSDVLMLEAEKDSPGAGETYRLRSETGKELCVDVSRSPIRNDFGHEFGSVVILHDITQRKAVEETLRKNEERFALITRGTSDGIWDYNLETGEIYFSERWKAMLGYGVDEFEDSFRAWQSVIHENDLGEILHAWTECMTGATQSFSVEYRLATRGEQWKWVECRGLVLLSDKGAPIRLAGSHTDISQRKASEQKMLWNSTHDTLTGLANRHAFEQLLDRELKLARRMEVEHALLYMDLDQFKVINDTCGHVAGDQLLRQLSAVLAKTFRGSDTLARLGGDEFAMFLKDCPVRKAVSIANLVRETIEDYCFVWEKQTFRVGASIGVVAINRTNASRNEVLAAADIACYAAKDLGRNRVHLYQESDDQMALRHREMHWVARITRALQDERFVLYCQPIVPVGGSGSAASMQEILVRMLDEKGGIVAPNLFIPAAERYNLMQAIDRWVIRNLFMKLARDSRDGCLDTELITTVNLSGCSINEEGFLNFIKEQFVRFAISPERICFEVTETVAVANLAQAAVFIEELKALGCLFALDDFGSGLSSFGYLKNLPVDYLKIDGQFVRDMVDDPIDAAMVSSINQIGQVMGMKTIAEFVENRAILERLRELGVDYAQGYGLAGPGPLDEVQSEKLKSNR